MAEESVECPYCDGSGYDIKVTGDPQEPEAMQIPCGYCYTSGRVTTKLMKEHINYNRAATQDDDLPF